jgi:hypothetical protein
MGTMISKGLGFAFLGAVVFSATGMFAQILTDDPAPSTSRGAQEMIDRVVSNQKQNDHAMDFYERIERIEVRKNGSDPRPSAVRISRVIPAGTGNGKIALGPDGKPVDAAQYRAELEKIVKALTWAVEDGRAQRDAYERVAKKRRERDELIDATRTAFFYTFVGQESRNGLMLSKYAMAPNPAFRPTSRMTTIFTKVQGYVWVDEGSAQLARIEGDVTEDISLALFLGKVYKGSHFMQERYEEAAGVWLPSFSQYDFDGRKFFSTFSIHERTFYSKYRRLGPPKEALVALRAELSKSGVAADP